MSECVVRMEMPKNRCPIRFSIAATGYCPIEDRSGCGFDITKERPDWCPIICSLPEWHGRLVDKDEMLKKIENYHRYMTVGRESDPRCIIEDSPTIVPAERRKK